MSASMQNNCTQFMFMPRCNINTTQHYQLSVYMSHVMQEYVLTVCDSSNIETLITETMSFYNTCTYVALTWNKNTIKTSTHFAMIQLMSANFKLNVYINETGNLVGLCCQFLSVGHNCDIITSLNISVESDQVWFDRVCVSHISRVWSGLIWSCLCKLLSLWLTQTHWDWVGL